MNFLTVIVFIVCVSELVSGRLRYDGHDCDLHAKTWRHLVECNVCRCKQGNLYDCTKYRCTSKAGFYMVCVEREVKWDPCSLCRCLKETWKCIKMPCTSGKTKRSITDSPCLDGMSRQEGCNECVCKSGHWTCSENTCSIKERVPRYVEFIQDDLNDVPCAPDDTLILDCFLCRCNENSIGFTCEAVRDCNVNQPLNRKITSAKIYLDVISDKDEKNWYIRR